MEDIFEIICQLVKKTAIPFMVAVIVLNIFGCFNNDAMAEISSLFHSNGITYQGIFELFILSSSIGLINTIFDLDKFMKKTLYLYKNILRIIIIVAVTIIFVWNFKWFINNNLDAWISFIIVFGLCIGISILLNIYITHKKSLEYQKLLIKYKERRR